ncbi:MAG TPA: M23 family metallopeptidase, partial [Pilimelia sp.]|nr:M23 family metallopeptidase [Pilimelia sp.]
APVRIGSRFQPLPGTLPTTAGPVAPAGAGLVLVAAAGTPVHAVEAGTVTLGAQPGEPLRLAGDGGRTFYYGGLAPGSVTVADGAHVAAGTILGTVAAPRLSRTPPTPHGSQPHLVLRIVDEAGADVDVAGFLVGLPDPNELGQAAVGAGVDVDPDAVDQEIAGAAARPTWEQPP